MRTPSEMSRIVSLAHLYEELQRFPEEFARVSAKLVDARNTYEEHRLHTNRIRSSVLLSIKREKGKTVTVDEIHSMVEIEESVVMAEDSCRAALYQKNKWEALVDTMERKHRSLLSLSSLVRQRINLSGEHEAQTDSAFNDLSL